MSDQDGQGNQDGESGDISPPPHDRVGNLLEKITNRVALVGTVIAGLVALNTSVSSCSKDNIDRHAAFRSSVDSEEKFWTGLYEQYLTTFEPAAEGVEPTVDKAKRAAKLRVIQALANHGVPDFHEHQLGLLWGLFSNSTSAQDQANKSLEAIKKSLVTSLSRSEDPQVAQSTQAAIFASDEAQTIRVAAADDKSSAPPTPVPLEQRVVQTGSAVISYQSQTLSTGAAKGWDIDIFWCAGTNEELRYGKAGAVAQILANAANAAGSKLPGSDLVLGRIRLRSLPANLQGKGYPTSGRSIWADASEWTRGKTLTAFLNASQNPPFVLSRTGKKTNWYLSAFVCS